LSTFANVRKTTSCFNAQVQRRQAAPLQPVDVIKVLHSEHSNRDAPGVPNVHGAGDQMTFYLLGLWLMAGQKDLVFTSILQ
jgi:hypothetical protein